MTFNVKEEIKKRSREEWVQLLKEKWIDLRITIQENGELAFVAAFVLGILVVMAFKLFIAVAVIAVLIAFAVWNFADPEANRLTKNADDVKVSSTVNSESVSQNDDHGNTH